MLNTMVTGEEAYRLGLLNWFVQGDEATYAAAKEAKKAQKAAKASGSFGRLADGEIYVAQSFRAHAAAVVIEDDPRHILVAVRIEIE